MTIFDKPGGASETPASALTAAERERRFAILHDDGVRARNMGEWPYAIRCLSEALQLKSDDETRSYLAECYLKNDQEAEALPLLAELGASRPKDVHLQLTLLHTAIDCRRPDEALEALKRAQAVAPADIDVRYADARLTQAQGNDLMAVAKATQVLAQAPDHRQARELRARTLLHMGQAAEALADARELTAQAPDVEAYHLIEGDALAISGRDEEAERAYNAALGANPFSTDAQLRLAALYARTHRLDKALSTCDALIEAHPDMAEAYRRRGAIKMALHNEAGAADDMKKSLELKPEQTAQLSGEFTNIENQMNERYRALNPYGF